MINDDEEEEDADDGCDEDDDDVMEEEIADLQRHQPHQQDNEGKVSRCTRNIGVFFKF